MMGFLLWEALEKSTTYRPPFPTFVKMLTESRWMEQNFVETRMESRGLSGKGSPESSVFFDWTPECQNHLN